MTGPPIGVRERTRRIVAAELTVVAQDLFVANGYEATTVDQIAAAAGMSRRTFFRYFASKDDLVIGKYDLFADQLVDALAARPPDEPVWASLRRVFDIVAAHVQDDQLRARNDAMERIVRSSPGLYATYLEKVSRIQELLVAGIGERLHSQSGPPAVDPDPRPAVIVGAAFACLLATQSAYLASDRSRPFADLLDDAMGMFQLT